MICPSCGHKNLPGSDECARCMFDLSSLDQPEGHDRVERSVMSDPVSELKPKPPVTISVHALLGDAVQVMVDKEIGALIVTDDSARLAGILTERDYLMKVVGTMGDYARKPVQEVMTPTVETLKPHDTIAYAIQKMDIGGYRHLPVVDDDGVPVGIISVRDLMRHVTRLCADT